MALGGIAGRVINFNDYTLVDGNAANPAQEYNRGFKTLNNQLAGPNRFALSPATPMAIRQLCVAQTIAKAQAAHGGPVSSDSIRAKTFWTISIGFALTLAARVIRVAFRTGFAILTVPYAFHQQHRYGVEGWGITEIKRIGYEWIDLLITTVTPFIALINTFSPTAIPMESIREYYLGRNQEVDRMNQLFNNAKAAYFTERAQVRAATHAARALEV